MNIIICPICGGRCNAIGAGWKCEVCGERYVARGEVTDMTNADRIRAMSDEELAIEMCQRSISTICDIVCQGECKAIATLNKTGGKMCKEIIMKWLQQPAEEDA